MSQAPKTVVIGAGIGGLAAALRLAHAGHEVTVLERARHPGGKIRTLPTPAGPADAGPTVLTMRHVFEELFEAVGERLSDHVGLSLLPVLARHFWEDGTRLDLTGYSGRDAEAVREAFGPRAAERQQAFAARAAKLFEAFDGPMMREPDPSQARLTAWLLTRPDLIAAMAPHRSLAGMLSSQLGDARLAQLYGRYSTYVGGTPYGAPALLSLISHAEAMGVWRVEGGVHALPRAIEALARRFGARFVYGAHVDEIAPSGGGVTVRAGGRRLTADRAVFNGDPRALRQGLLGKAAARAVPRSATEPRSLSACVAAFAARASGPGLSHHNVFFGDQAEEFGAVAAGRLPQRGTLYLCAQDAGTPGMGRFEIILNAPAGLEMTQDERAACLRSMTRRLASFGLSFDPEPGPEALTVPQEFGAMFPASLGALYGRSPHGLTASLRRPRARTRMEGLYLAGGGAHPGAGVPMATLSGAHAAEAILADLPSTSRSRPLATPGGTSMPSPTTARARSPSSAS